MAMNNKPAAPATKGEYEAATAWINVYITTKSGQKKQIGKNVPLLESVPLHANIIAKAATPQGLEELLNGQITIEYQYVGHKASDADEV